MRSSIAISIAAIAGLSAIGVAAVITNHDGAVVNAVVGAICSIVTYSLTKRKYGNGGSGH